MCFAERIQGLLDEAFEDHHPLLGVGAVSVPVDLDQGNMLVRVVPWIRGRMFSLIHKPSGYEWMEGRMEYGGYEDITGVDLQSSANPEDFKVVKYVYKHPGLELICAVLIMYLSLLTLYLSLVNNEVSSAGVSLLQWTVRSLFGLRVT